MKRYSQILIVFFIVVVLIFFIFHKNIFKDGYEMTELEFDICQKNCYDQGYDHDICSDKDKLEGCIAMLSKNADIPPLGTSFAPQE